MKIISWNLWCKNHTQVRSVHRILKGNPDVLCLQEVSPKTVKVLEGLEDYDCLSASDYYNAKKGHKSEYKLVILLRRKSVKLVKHQILDVRHITRTTLWDRFNRWQESLEYQYADIITETGPMRIFNIHLEIGAGPKLRFEQFEFVLKHLASHGRNVICGDFNTFARWYLNLIAGLPLGYKWHEYATNERGWFEAQFRKFGFNNPLRFQSTYPRYNLQLDHILVPREWELREAKVLDNLHNSDHFPIQIELTGRERKGTQLSAPRRRLPRLKKLPKLRLPRVKI